MSLRYLGFLLVLAGLTFLLTGQTVTVQLNGRSYRLRSHATQVQTVLRQAGLALNSADLIDLPLTTSITAATVIQVTLARPVHWSENGQVKQAFTQQTTLSGLLEESDLTPHDEVFWLDQRLNLTDLLPFTSTPAPPRLFLGHWLIASRPEPLILTLRRATPVRLHQGALRTTFYTTQPTLQQALQQQGVTIWPEDKLVPPLTSPIRAGLEVYWLPAQRITWTVDGQRITQRTHATTLGAALAETGIALMGQDFTRPDLNHPVTPHLQAEVVRVQTVLEVTETYLPFETRWQASEELELDQMVVVEAGQPGIIQTRWRVRYENGQVVQRELQEQWLAQEAQTRAILYGTKIVLRTLPTPHGPIEYWRKIPMLTTSYSAATSGKPRNHPNYGFTRTGKRAGFGLVAVDPQLIPLQTKLYIPNYGLASAEDTGGGVLGKHVDLGFNEDSPPLWYGWHEVYLLPPVPPLYQIRYVLPEWPQR